MVRYARRMDGVRPSAIRELLVLGADADVISFGGGYPDPTLFPVAGLLEATHRVLRDGPERALQYTVTDGLPALREWIANRVSLDGTRLAAEGVLVLQGAQQGLDLVAKLLLDPGDVVITEDPTFLGALIAFAPYEPRIVPVPMDADGMLMDALEAALIAEPRARFIYTVPDFHNPTGVTMSAERRRQLAELAERFDVLVLEDSPYRELRFEGEQLPSIAATATGGRVLQLGSFSKVLAPGLRLGWVAGDPQLIQALGLLKLAADTQTSTLNMAIALDFLSHHDLDAHIRMLRIAYRAKRDLMLATITESFPATVSATLPAGGLFTWLTFPERIDTAAFLRERVLPNARVAYVPGAGFFPDVVRHNHARLNFSGVDETRLVDGVRRLGAEFARV